MINWLKKALGIASSNKMLFKNSRGSDFWFLLNHIMAASSGAKEKRESDASTLSLGPELKNTHPLLVSETLLLLQNYSTQREQYAQTTGYPFPGLPVATSKTIEHCTQFSKYSNREIIREIRQSMLNTDAADSSQSQPQTERMKSGRGMVEFEMVQVANLLPETVEEARALVPSLAGSVDEDDLQRILDDLSTIRRFQS